MKTFFKSFLVVLVVLGLLLCLSSCGKLKSIGGFMANVPTEEGEMFLNVGEGGYLGEEIVNWVSDPYNNDFRAIVRDMTTLSRHSPDSIESKYIIQMSGDTVIFHYNLTQAERVQRSSIGADASKCIFRKMGIEESDGYYIFTNDDSISWEDNSDLETNNHPNIHFIFTIDSPGLYFFRISSCNIFIRK